MYRVHRATVARWIAAARQGVLDRTRRRLMHDLRLAAGEVYSLIRLVQSRIARAWGLVLDKHPRSNGSRSDPDRDHESNRRGRCSSA